MTLICPLNPVRPYPERSVIWKVSLTQSNAEEIDGYSKGLTRCVGSTVFATTVSLPFWLGSLAFRYEKVPMALLRLLRAIL